MVTSRRGGGLVGNEQVGLAGERHRDHDALPHAAGELVRIIMHARSALGIAPVQQLDRAGERLLLRQRSLTRRLSTICSPTVNTGLSGSSAPGR